MDSVRVKVGIDLDRRARFFLGVAESIGLIQTCLVAKAFATHVGGVASLNPVYVKRCVQRLGDQKALRNVDI